MYTIEPRMSAEEHFASLNPIEKMEMAALFIGVVRLIEAKRLQHNTRRQMKANKQIGSMAEGIEL